MVKAPNRSRGRPASPDWTPIGDKITTNRISAEAKRAQIADAVSEKIAAIDSAEKEIEQRRSALRHFIERFDVNRHRWCKAAKVNINIIYNFLNGESNSIRAETYQKLAEAAQVPVSEINGDALYMDQPGVYPVIGYVGAGSWQESTPFMEADDRFDVAAPLPEPYRSGPNAQNVFGLRVTGTSMNQFYPDGSVVLCIPIYAARDIQSSDHVVVESRRKDGMIEATIKEYVVDAEDNMWLWPRSDDPMHQSPLPYGNDAVDSVEVTALIIGSYRPAPNF